MKNRMYVPLTFEDLRFTVWMCTYSIRNVSISNRCLCATSHWKNSSEAATLRVTAYSNSEIGNKGLRAMRCSIPNDLLWKEPSIVYRKWNVSFRE